MNAIYKNLEQGKVWLANNDLYNHILVDVTKGDHQINGYYNYFGSSIKVISLYNKRLDKTAYYASTLTDLRGLTKNGRWIYSRGLNNLKNYDYLAGSNETLMDLLLDKNIEIEYDTVCNKSEPNKQFNTIYNNRYKVKNSSVKHICKKTEYVNNTQIFTDYILTSDIEVYRWFKDRMNKEDQLWNEYFIKTKIDSEHLIHVNRGIIRNIGISKIY